MATLEFEWVHWFDNRRLLDPLGWLPAVEYEQEFYDVHTAPAKAA